MIEKLGNIADPIRGSASVASRIIIKDLDSYNDKKKGLTRFNKEKTSSALLEGNLFCL
jgi:hypothetical protein